MEELEWKKLIEYRPESKRLKTTEFWERRQETMKTARDTDVGSTCSAKKWGDTQADCLSDSNAGN